MRFEIGKYYKHASGNMMRILGRVEGSTRYRNCLVGETLDSANFMPVGEDETSAENWSEATREEWERHFD